MSKTFVYILKSSKDKKHYIGHTEDLYKRLQRHNSHDNKSTRHRGEFSLVYYEQTPTLADAIVREKYLKDLGVKRFLGQKNLKLRGVAQPG